MSEVNEETVETVENTEENAEETTAEVVEEGEDLIAKLQKENQDLQEQVAKLKNAYAMAYADTDNTRKRLNKEFEQLNKYKAQSFALSMLPVLDDCERALAHKSEDEVYRKGLEMIHSKLKAALEAEGVTEIEAINQPFDANWHQALMTEHVDGVEPGIVIEVLQKGYKLKDRILRAAMVKVSE